MTAAPVRVLPTPHVVERTIPRPPPWVERLLGHTVPSTSRLDGVTLTQADLGDLVWIEARADDAIALASPDLVRQVEAIYHLLRRRLGALHPLRFWNFLPGIHRRAHDGMDIYEAFNSGRFTAFDAWYGRADFARQMVAATGVGHHDAALTIQVLAGARPAEGLENPRQIAAWRYSRRYGPLPPCFARASRVVGLTPGDPNAETLILAGTASVVGEDSRHDALERQIAETCVNLRHLLDTAGTTLDRLRELRAYRLAGVSPERLTAAFAARLPGLDHLELVDAELCRRDLLVEVEGVVPL